MNTIQETIDELRGEKSEWTEPCPHCGKLLLTYKGILASASDPRLSELDTECDCEQAVAEREEAGRRRKEEEEKQRKLDEQERKEALFRRSGMPEVWKGRKLAMWKRETAAQDEAYQAAVQFGADYCAGSKPEGLYISGGVGTGKTFLASCLARELHRKGKAVLWTEVGTILQELRRTYDMRDETEGDVLERYQNAKLLILDDLGKERPSEWAVEQLYRLINYRYNNELPIIITTNYNSKERLVQRLIAPSNGEYADDATAWAIVDRLRAMCRQIKLEGQSKR